MKIDGVKEYIVIVNEGSGCIFQPMDYTCSYILTAKHNIVNKDNQITQLIRFKFNQNSWDEIDIAFDLLENVNYFPHPDRDIAILKVDKIPDLENIIRFDDLDSERTGYVLAGYPATRRWKNADNKENWYRYNENITILTTNANQLREGKVPENAGWDEIVGQSGGGILKISGDYIMLAGIQNKMVHASDKEQMGRIEFSPICLFDEIIAAHPEHLSPLYPPYFQSFKSLKEQIMKLDGCQFYKNVEYTRRTLLKVADEIAEHPLTPGVIKEKLKTRMLIRNEEEVSLLRKGLWIAWLELLVVLKITGKDPQTEQDLEDIFNKYRVLYSASKEDWGNLLYERIAYSDYKGLAKNACIIFANETPPQKTMINSKNLIIDIGRHIDEDEMKIDAGITNPFESFKHIHIHAFQKDCIINNEDDYFQYDNTNKNELLQHLKQAYERIISNN